MTISNAYGLSQLSALFNFSVAEAVTTEAAAAPAASRPLAEEEEVGGGHRLAEEDTTLGLIMEEVACVSVTMATVEAEAETKAEADEAADGVALLVVVGFGPGNPRRTIKIHLNEIECYGEC